MERILKLGNEEYDLRKDFMEPPAERTNLRLWCFVKGEQYFLQGGERVRHYYGHECEVLHWMASTLGVVLLINEKGKERDASIREFPGVHAVSSMTGCRSWNEV